MYLIVLNYSKRQFREGEEEHSSAQSSIDFEIPTRNGPAKSHPVYTTRESVSLSQEPEDGPTVDRKKRETFVSCPYTQSVHLVVHH